MEQNSISVHLLFAQTGPSPDFLKDLIGNSKKFGGDPGSPGNPNNGILEKLILLRQRQQSENGSNNENEDSINSSMAGGSEGGGGTEGKLLSSKSLPASPLNKFESSPASQQELFLAAARTAVANAAARYANVNQA